MRLSILSAAILIAAGTNAQVTVTTAAQNTQQTYYSLANGVVSNHALADWDLAFELTGITGGILLNTAKGHKLYKAPYTLAQWSSVDTTGLAGGWPEQHNSETNWSSGAFNRGLTANPFDLGWGIYNFTTHNIVGDSCFVLQLNGGAWKKFKVDGFAAATNSFTFTWADLDGSNEQSGSLVRSAYPGKNFGYYNLATNTAVDLEPAAATWDLLFTKYIGFVTQPFPSMYPVAGVLQNRQVEALQVDGVPTAEATYWGEAFSPSINIIGFDWKNFNQGTFQWEYAQDRTYFVKDRAGDIYKLVFTGYGGSANGNMTFNQELVGQANVDEASSSSALVIAPNPATNTATLIIAAEANAAQLTIIDLNGRVVMEQQLTGLHGLVQRPINVSALPNGLYIARVQGDGINGVVRLVKE
ncbi:MAG TPA: T9SS type A sorting domain-containing protein [Flavobacteriales bacterium]|nr:T9SS type A sorting domain-containing protein [Flavobacteriales bacterium]